MDNLPFQDLEQLQKLLLTAVVSPSPNEVKQASDILNQMADLDMEQYQNSLSNIINGELSGGKSILIL